MSRRRLLDDSYKKTVEGNPAIATDSLARRYPGIVMQGWTEQETTTGAQLFDKSTIDPDKYVSDTNGTVNESSDGGTAVSDYVLVSGLSYVCATITSYRQWMSFYDTEKNYISGVNGYSDPIAVPESAVYARFTIPNDYIDSFMVNAGQTLLPWEPYTGGQPSPSPEYPQEITSAGNWNETAQKREYEIEISNAEQNPTEIQTVTLQSDRTLTKWDKLEKRNGQWGWVYSSAEIVFDGSEDESWSKRESAWSGSIFLTNISSFADGNDVKYQSMCEKLIPYEGGWDAMPLYHFQNVDHVIGIAMEESISTVETLRTWLSENPLTVLYQTAEETFVPLSQTEQEQMNALHTFRPTTVLSNDADCEMELTYKTKKSLEVTA